MNWQRCATSTPKRPGLSRSTGNIPVNCCAVKLNAHFGSPDPSADQETLARLAAERPHVLLVAYGAPKQELWIDRMGDQLPGVAVAIGVGGAFDYLTGRVPRAPRWMRRVGMEWLFRLAQQPWRIRRMAVLPAYAVRVLRAHS